MQLAIGNKNRFEPDAVIAPVAVDLAIDEHRRAAGGTSGRLHTRSVQQAHDDDPVGVRHGAVPPSGRENRLLGGRGEAWMCQRREAQGA